MSIREEARQEAERRWPVEEKTTMAWAGRRIGFEEGAVWAREQDTREPSAAEAEAVARAFCREWPLIPMGEATDVAVDALIDAQEVRRG